MEISKSNYLCDFTYADNFQCYTNISNQLNNAIIPYEKLNNYTQMSIHNFKLEGRTFPNNYVVLQDLINYCIKPEWKLLVLRYMINWMESFDLNNYNIEKYNIK